MKLPIALSTLVVTSFAAATPHVKAINIASCTPLGAAMGALPAYGAIADGTSNAVGTVDGQHRVELYCDAALPDEATAYDGVELEYFAWAPPGGPVQAAPTVAAYLDSRGLWGAHAFPGMSALASCTGTVSTATMPAGLATCVAWGSASLAPVTGPGQRWQHRSVHFLVTLPPIPQNATNEVYRLLVHYRAP